MAQFDIPRMPLYEDLWRDCQQNPVVVNMNEACVNINDLHKSLSEVDALEHRETIAALIIHHQTLLQRGIVPVTFPGNHKVMAGGKGVLVYVQHRGKTMVPDLQMIIAKYVEVFGQKRSS